MASHEAKPNLYRPLFPLARGGLGEVTLVLRSEGDFKRLYAMKRLHRRFALDEDINRMFLAEARLAGLLRHSNIVSVLDVGCDEDGPYLVMELVEGITVADLLKKHAAKAELIPLAVVLEIVMQACRGLDALHQLRALDGSALHIVHRDVSPQNLLLGYDGVVQLTDFGIAKDLSAGQNTTTGVLRGKSGYMSPEQVRMEPLSFRSDLFSLGVVLWELLSGERLYGGTQSEKSPARQIMEDVPADPIEFRSDVSPELSEVVFDLLAKEPEHRPESARSVVDRLGGILAMTDRNEDLSTFVSEEFKAEKAAFAQEVQEALEATTLMPRRARRPSSSNEPKAIEPKRKPYWAALALAVVVGGSALAFAWSGSSTSIEEPEMAQPSTGPSEAIPEALPTVEVPTDMAEEVIEAPTPAIQEEAAEEPPVRRRRRRTSMMRATPTSRPAQMTKLDDDTWWER